MSTGNLDDCPNKELHVLTTLYQMVKDRGFTVDKDFDPAILQDENTARTWYVRPAEEEAIYRVLMTGEDATHQRLAVILQLDAEEKIGVTRVRELVEAFKLYSRVILVYYGLTPTAKAAFTRQRKFHLFLEKDLYRNITQHVLYVPHRALSPAEEEALLQQYGATKAQFPRLLKEDKVARYFGFEKGTMVHIVRRLGGMVQRQDLYRVVGDAQ